MVFYFFNPISKQLYFQKGFDKYQQLVLFYKPYKLWAKLLWLIWRKVKVFRELWKEQALESIIPLDVLISNFDNTMILGFNIGQYSTKKKISVIGVNSKNGLFIKYSEAPSERKKIIHEAKIIDQLHGLEFVPVNLGVIANNKYAMLKTTIFSGKQKYYYNNDFGVLEILKLLSKQKIEVDNNHTGSMKTCFGHGDFCPWNMIISRGRLFVYDWESANIYPLGYDLFTYIFQTMFLIKPHKSISKILTKNLILIENYFSFLRVTEWKQYLLEFSRIKYHNEINNVKLNDKYSKLMKYAKKI